MISIISSLIVSDVRPWPWPWPWPWPEAENLRPWPWPWPWGLRPWPWPWPWGFRPWPWPWPWGSRPWPWPWPWGSGLDRGLESLMFHCQSIILFRQCVIKFPSLCRYDGEYVALRLCFSLISTNCREPFTALRNNNSTDVVFQYQYRNDKTDRLKKD